MNKSRRKTFITKIILLVVLLLIGGFWIFKSMVMSPQVALIATGGDEPAACTSNIASFTTTNTCGKGMVNRVDYECLQDGKKGYEGGKIGDCIDPTLVYQHAIAYCGQTCSSVTTFPQPTSTSIPNPSPSLPPNPTPYPTQTPVSSTEFSCNVQVYKLRNDDNPQGNPSTYATSDRRVEPSQTRVSAGELYALIVEETSNREVQVSTISASTENVAGSNEPIKITATSPYCSSTDSWGKYMSCTHPSIRLLANTPIPLKIGMTIQIQNNIYEMSKTSIRFGLYNILQNAGYKSDCYVTLLSSETVNTPTPVPTTAPGCYTEQRFCIQSLVGGNCPTVTICPSANPTPTPVPSPVYSSKPSPTPTSTSCGTNLNKWQFKESCGTNMYRYIYYNCTGSTASQTQGSSSSCKSESTWVNEARNSCMKTPCVSISPIPVVTTSPTSTAIPTIAPRSITRQTFGQCYSACRNKRIGAWSCLRSCTR